MMEEVFGEGKLVVYLCGMESWKHSRNISRLNGQKSFKNVVWIYWMKSRCLYICTVAFLQYIAALAAHNLSQYKGQCASRCSCI